MTQLSTTEAARAIGRAVRSLQDGPVFLTSREDVVAVLLAPADYRRLRQLEGRETADPLRAVAS